MSIDKKIQLLGLVLPRVGKPVGKYSPLIHLKEPGLIFLSGQLPFKSGGELIVGKLTKKEDIEFGKEAARAAALTALAQIKEHFGSLDYIKSIVQIVGYVNASADFIWPHQVLDGASELLASVIPQDNFPSRVAIGASSLPLNVAVEISMTLNTRS